MSPKLLKTGRYGGIARFGWDSETFATIRNGARKNTSSQT
jgi:hypothetical protein